MTLALGPTSGWIALALIPLTGLIAWVLRRFVKGRFSARMKPHEVLGYAVLGITIVHLVPSLGGMAGSNGTGIWLATLALFGLIVQALIGLNLQSPGGYRLELRRWHIVASFAVLLLAAGHVVFNGPAGAMFSMSSMSLRLEGLRHDLAPNWNIRNVASRESWVGDEALSRIPHPAFNLVAERGLAQK